ncbi:hypothetical protein OHA11_14015 [Streptomyces sp. NBC_00878]|nr:hypothetical protein [Streptomyces sp. NBC_00878]
MAGDLDETALGVEEAESVPSAGGVLRPGFAVDVDTGGDEPLREGCDGRGVPGAEGDRTS